MPAGLADAPRRPLSTPRCVIPLESEGSAWLVAVRRTLLSLLLRPSASFAVCPEPIAHGRVLAFIATLRLPLWVVLLVAIAGTHVSAAAPTPEPMRAIYQVIEAPLAQALSMWVVLMVPIGIPLLYFFGGLVAHVGVALTGGASRSVGATMRVVGYGLAPALLVVGGLDVPLYLGRIEAPLYLGIVGATAVALLWVVALGLARTHQTSVVRGFLVGLLPVLLFGGVTVGRAALELKTLPGLPAADAAYYVP